MLTMGTTDTFGVDRVQPVCEIRDRLCAQFEVAVKSHIHVDSAIGWPLLFLLDYDFEKNPLEINAATLSGLQRNVDRFRELRLADSFTIDFQKWGYVPYTSSLVMIRNRDDLKALEHDPEYFSYFEKNMEGQSHLHSTMYLFKMLYAITAIPASRCSRGSGKTGLDPVRVTGLHPVMLHEVRSNTIRTDRIQSCLTP